MDVILEQFNLDPLAGYSGFVYEDATSEVLSYIKEASEGTTKKNIFQKLWALIKKLIDLIMRGLSKLFDWLKTLFTRKAKTADQISAETLARMGIKVTHLKRTKLKVTELKKANIFNTVPKNIKVKDPMTGEITEEKMDLLAKAIQVKIEDNLLYLNITPGLGFEGNLKVSTHHKNDPSNLWSRYGKRFKAFYDNADKIEQAIAAIQNEYKAHMNASNAKDYLNFNPKSFLEKLNDLTDIVDEYASTNKDTEAVDLDHLKKMQDVIAQLSTFVNDFSGEPDQMFNEAEKSLFIKNINSISNDLFYVQMGLNAILTALSQKDKIDACYRDTITTPEQLAVVTKAFIDNHISPGNITTNIWAMLSPNFVESVGKIPHGQTRFVIYDKKLPIVYKCATNPVGILHNGNEVKISNLAKSKNVQKYLAIASEVNDGTVVIKQDQAKSPDESKKRSNFISKFDELKFEITSKDGEFAKATGLVLADQHDSNVGFIGNTLVTFDYGDYQKVV